MLIRKKILLATAIPISLLILQVIFVNYFIRELQSAVRFIGAAQSVIEADLSAKDQLSELRREIKNVPQVYVQSTHSPIRIDPLWREISQKITSISASSVLTSINTNTIESVKSEYQLAELEISNIQHLLEDASPDMDTLLVHAISTNNALEELDQTLSRLAIELRQQLQEAVDREQLIHNRPIIAGAVIGGLAILLLMILVWFFVDKGIVRRLTRLSQSMLAIAGGDLHAKLPTQQSNDEIGSMSKALSIFQENAIEIQDSNRREIIQKRKQRQFWLEHMASFLRHEVKNKQVGAEQSIRLLASKEGENPQVSKYCERATSSLVDMKELINCTVDAADVESALISEDFTKIYIPNLIVNYTKKMNDHFDAGIICINDIAESCYVWGDQLRLEQMMDKLIDNALDFREFGTEVTIRLKQHNSSSICIEVENIGPVLNGDTRELFRLSYSARTSDKKVQGNVGFGLFVAMRIADYHNGSIEAASTDTGAVFTVCLPVTKH